MVRPKENLVFNYFTYSKIDNKSVCNTCGSRLLGKHSGNLGKHLKIHKEVFEIYEKAENERKKVTAASAGSRGSCSSSPTPPAVAPLAAAPPVAPSAECVDEDKQKILHSVFGAAWKVPGTTKETDLKEIMEFEENPVPDLSDRMGMDAPPSQGKMEASSNYLTCSPLISAMPGIHEELMHGAGPSSSYHDHFEGESLPGDYEGEEMMEVKQEPVLSMSSEICEDENSQNNTQSSSDRRSTQSSPTPVGMAGPYLLKKETHCSTILDQLLRDDTFSDVTLTAEGQSIRAHKIVLCLASAYFRQVLSKESTVQNVIVFRDIKFSELRNLINFIYTGEATVDASDLESFMKTAEMLEVNSLSDGQRNIPKNFLPRAREMEPDRPPRGPSSSSSKRSSQNAGPGSPPSKSRRTSAEVSPPPRTYKQTFPTTVASGPPVPPLVQFPPPVIKTEPKSEESLEDDFPTQREEEQEVYDNHDRSPSQPHDPDQSPPLDRLGDPSASEIPPPGKCPFCSGPQPVWRERALTKHLYVCHPDKTVFPCDICSRAFLKESAYETHKDDCR